MLTKQNTLYLTYDGLTDPLGQSQVIPYLIGIRKAGYPITVISFEKKKYASRKATISRLLREQSINWEPLSYTFRPPVLSTLYDLERLKRKVSHLYRINPFEIIHCRSYIPALIGLSLKKQYGDQIRFIFDMRGFWPDERVEGGSWNLKNPAFRAIYSFFKRKEIEFLTSADAIVSLTVSGKEAFQKFDFGGRKLPVIHVIPCCVDTELFDQSTVGSEETRTTRTKLGICKSDLILVYLGSIGSWYLLDEMLRFFKAMKSGYPSSKFLFITKDPPDSIISSAKYIGINENDLIIHGADREQLPRLMSVASIGICFIKPCFSKRASSPTKHGEMLAMAIPTICNKGVGDVDILMDGGAAGYIVDSFSKSEFQLAVNEIPRLLKLDRKQVRKTALDNLSLKDGIRRYIHLYQSL